MATGVIGLGNIGGAVAANLVADGHEVVVHDLDRSAAEAVEGASVAADVAAVAHRAEITLLSLPTPQAVEQVATAWAGAAAPGSILVDLSTNDPAVVRGLGDRLASTGHQLVDAPLTGGAVGAQRRMLVFMLGGTEDAVARVRPVLEPLGRAAFHVGGLGCGSTMKLLNSLIAFTTTWVSLEGLSLAARAGIEVREAVEILRTAGASNFYLDRLVETIDERGRPTQFALALAAKDAGLIVDTGAELGVPTPVGSAVRDVLVRAVDEGLGGADWSELVALAEQQAGVELRWNPSPVEHPQGEAR
jgi:3-hydroxyisobutyrate dehydrogenase